MKIRTKITLETLSQVKKFVELASKYPEDVYLCDASDSYIVSGKSMLAALLAHAEWSSTYVVYNTNHKSDSTTNTFDSELRKAGLI